MDSTLDLQALNNGIVNLFDNGLNIYTSFANRLAAAKLTLKETDAKIAAIENPKPVTAQIMGIDQNTFIIGAAALLVVTVLILRRK